MKEFLFEVLEVFAVQFSRPLGGWRLIFATADSGTVMDIPTIHPRALRPGSVIGIAAPAGPVENREGLDRGVAALVRLGFQVRFDERIFQSFRYLAGSDEARAGELQRLFEDDSIDAVVALRGGYGCARLIPLLDEGRLRPHCKLFMGFSDLTTMHLFFRRRFGWVTIHGPMAVSASLGNVGTAEEENLYSLLTDPGYRLRLTFPELESWVPGTEEGKLVGGCLSLVAASIGTAYQIKTEGKILFLEDLGEPPYRVDRMLTQLRLAGILDSVAGVLLGRFQDCNPERGDYTVEDVLHEHLEALGVPVIAHFPAGHGNENWSLPLGVKIKLDADTRQIEALEPAVV